MKRQLMSLMSQKSFDINEISREIICKHLSDDAFCDENRENLIRDFKSNTLIQNSPSIVCIVDYEKNGYLYATENICNTIDITADELVNGGLARGLLVFDEVHCEIAIEEIFPETFKQYALYAAAGKAKDIHLLYNSLIRTPDGTMQWFMHQMSVLNCDDKGYPRYAIKFLTNINDFKKDNILNFTIYIKNEHGGPQTLFTKDYFPYFTELSEREKEIDELVTNGYSSKSISDKLFISLNTVQTHRKNIARKKQGLLLPLQDR